MALLNRICLFLLSICVFTFSQVESEKSGRFTDENGHTRQWISSASRFKRCCYRKPVGYDYPRMRKSCRELCTYDTFTDSSRFVGAFLTGVCNMPEMGQIIFCGSRFQDHKDCCQAAGVTPKCLLFCRPAYEQMSESPEHMACLTFFPQVKKCFVDWDRANQMSARVRDPSKTREDN